MRFFKLIENFQQKSIQNFSQKKLQKEKIVSWKFFPYVGWWDFWIVQMYFKNILNKIIVFYLLNLLFLNGADKKKGLRERSLKKMYRIEINWFEKNLIMHKGPKSET